MGFLKLLSLVFVLEANLLGMNNPIEIRNNILVIDNREIEEIDCKEIENSRLLVGIDILFCRIDPRIYEDLFSLKKWGRLSIISIRGSGLSSKGCKFLSKIGLQNLNMVDLSSNCIENHGVYHLSKASVEVKNLNLSDNFLSHGVCPSLNRWNTGQKTLLNLLGQNKEGFDDAFYIDLLLAKEKERNSRINKRFYLPCYLTSEKTKKLLKDAKIIFKKWIDFENLEHFLQDA